MDEERIVMMGLYERVPFEQVIVFCGRQAGMQIYIRTWTPAYEQDRFAF